MTATTDHISNADFRSTQTSVDVSAFRDPRLDFYRGLAMFIILIAHTPGNFWTLWIPARFGFSDATEIFVFCSGMASAIAFGKAFEHRGWWLGTARVVFRMWQVYWAHICVFLVIAATMAFLNTTELFEKNYINSLNLGHFFKNPEANIVGLMTLTYVPNYFDILPMYIVILGMMPIVVGLKALNTYSAAVFVIVVWVGANMNILHFPAEPWSNREWFFNPFGWQLVFFTGFAFMAGWLPPPALNKWLIGLAIGIVIITIPFDYFRILRAVPELKAIAQDIRPLTQKTDFGILRYIHFLALAYLGWAVAGEKGKRLIAVGASIGAVMWRGILTVILKVGQQSLAVFVFSMVAARLIGFALDQVSRSTLNVCLANLTGFAMIIGVAYCAAWFKSQPWRKAKGGA